MPWKECAVIEERFRFIEDWLSEDWNVAELCRHYGVSRATGYKWLDRYEGGGLDGLRDQSRAPLRHPNALSDAIEDEVIALRAKHPSWGAPKIRARLARDHAGLALPAESSIGAILKRKGLTVTRRKRPHSRPSAEPLVLAGSSNEVWSADFKGCFHTTDGTRIDPLTITDHYSRYLFRCHSVKAADTVHSKPVFEAAFREFGLPRRIRTDNGAPFGSSGETGLTALSAWWIRLGIVPERIEPGKPQQNGRHERMHRTLKQETASPPAANPRRQQERFDRFRNEYNQERPHQALAQQTPASLYQPSPRVFPERLRQAEYPTGWLVRRISPGGQMRWNARSVFVSHAMQGDAVGLEPVDDGLWRVWFHFYEAGIFDQSTSRLRRPSPAKTTPPTLCVKPL
jgi:transposase InsO family protein